MAENPFLKKVKRILQGEIDPEYPDTPAARAIVQVLQNLLNYDLATEEEILAAVNIYYKSEWGWIAGEIARKAEKLIRAHTLDPNQLKPWIICRQYRTEFPKLCKFGVWRSLHGAINNINTEIAKRFQPPSPFRKQACKPYQNRLC